MRTSTRAGCVLAFLLAGCGDQVLGIPASAQVQALDDVDAVEVCGEFVGAFCRDTPPPPFDGVCTSCVVDELCGSSGVAAEMADACSGVTVGQVRDCAGGRTEGLCAAQTGGCMLDVAEAICSP
jgi:hypothetical protein